MNGGLMTTLFDIALYLLIAGLAFAVAWFAAGNRSRSEAAATEAREVALRETAESRNTQMKDVFELAATNALKNALGDAEEEKKKSFTAATESLSVELRNYVTAMDKVEKASIARVSALTNEVGNVSKLGMELADETRDLTRALKGDSQAQGAWGEVVVENILQSMGFVEGRDYVKQLSETTAENKRKRTDFVLNLPNDRQVIIDSKVSLTDYEKYVNAEDEETAMKSLKAHCNSIRNHASGLAAKNYDHMESINSLDFVLMVVPLESAFIAALKADSNLYDELNTSNRVRIVSGSTIMIALLLIQELWKRENQSRNQTELVNRAGQLHDKVTLFLESFTDVGFEISQAKEAFDKAESQLISGKGNVIRQAEQMRELGAKTSKELRGSKRVKKLAEQADFEEDNELLITGLDDDAVSSNSAPHVTIVDKSPPLD